MLACGKLLFFFVVSPLPLLIKQVIFLIFFNGYCSQYFIIFPWLGPSLSTHIRLLPLNILLGIVWLTYYLAVTTDPGAVPRWYEPTEAAAGKTGLRWCRKCKVFKPYVLSQRFYIDVVHELIIAASVDDVC